MLRAETKSRSGRAAMAAAWIALGGALAGAACSSAELVDTRANGQDDGGGTSDTDGGATSGDGGSSGGDAGLALSSSVDVVVEPSDNGAALLQSVQGAKKSVHIAMYILTDDTLVNALVAQKKAGRDVLVLLNKNFPAGGNLNYTAWGTLHNAGIDVRYAPAGFTFSHEKVVLVDGHDAWIMTMNTSGSSATSNREYLARDTDADDVAEAEAVFQGDFNNQSVSPQGKLLVAPNNARAKIEQLIQSATKSIALEAEEISDDEITGMLTAKADAGVALSVVLNGTQAPTPAQQQSIDALKKHKAKVVTLKSPDMHAKVIVVDDTVAYVGSANLTYVSIMQNREVGLFTGTAAAVQKIASTIATDLAAGTPL